MIRPKPSQNVAEYNSIFGEKRPPQLEILNFFCVFTIYVQVVHICAHAWLVGRARFNVPLDSLGHFGDDVFYRSDDPTNSVKALKEGG